MPSVTLVEAAKLHQNPLVQGVIENIYTTNRMLEQLPFQAIDGNAIQYNRENVLGDVQQLGVGGTITAKAAATFTRVSSGLVTLIGDAEVNQFIQATQTSTDQTATQVASKAKSLGRLFQTLLITGSDANANEFDGLVNLVAAPQVVTSAANGQALSFEIMDDLLDRVKSKDGAVDFITMSGRELRAYFRLLRQLGGAGIGEVVTLPSGTQVPAYRGVPIFQNDYIPTNQTQGDATNASTVFAGCLDDGSQTNGLAGLTAAEESGIVVQDVGLSETKDERITRVKWYCGLALYNEKALAAAPGIIPAGA